tara:strand:+ start:486 stop:785 length:300 start_codon:yes stop_codon:yes gene_type:complete
MVVPEIWVVEEWSFEEQVGTGSKSLCVMALFPPLMCSIDKSEISNTWLWVISEFSTEFTMYAERDPSKDSKDGEMGIIDLGFNSSEVDKFDFTLSRRHE